MDDNKRTVSVEKDLRPAYYDDFHCIMGACRHNCCDDPWRIEFNKRDYLAIKQAPKSAEMEELTRRCMRRLREKAHGDFYAELHTDEELGRCGFHTPEGLCRLQMECGIEVLPYVCRTYPRTETYQPSGYLERSLSPSCEAVLELLWNLPEGIEFRSDDLPRDRHQQVTFLTDSPLLTCFPVVREWCIDLLQNRKFTLPQRIWLMGLGLKELADGETDIDRWMRRAVLLPEAADVSGILPTGEAELVMFLSDCVNTLLGMTSNALGLPTARNQLLKSLELEAYLLNPKAGTTKLAFSTAAYCQAREAYEARYGGQDHFMENLMVTVFFHLHLPYVSSREGLWKSYVNFCNLYAIYRFLTVMSCREGVEDTRAELFRLIVFASRCLIHNAARQNQLRDELFQNDSATLAHMAILLSG